MKTPQVRVYLKCELGEREILINIVVQFLCSCSQVSFLQMRIEIVFRQVARVRESLMEERKSWCRSVLAPPDHCLPSQGPLSLFLSVYFQYFSRCIFSISFILFHTHFPAPRPSQVVMSVSHSCWVISPVLFLL